MVGTILFFIAIPFSAVAGLIAIIVNYMVLFMNYLIDSISKFPGSVISDIRFGFMELMTSVIICVVGLTIYYFGTKRCLNYFIITCLICYLGFGLIQYHIDERKNEIIVYNVKEGVAISIIDGHKHMLLASSEIFSDYSTNCRPLINYWVQRQINKGMMVINIDTISENITLLTSMVSVSQNNAGFLLQADSLCYLIPTNSFSKRKELPAKGMDEKFFLKTYPDIVGIDNFALKNIHGIIMTGGIPMFIKRKWKSESENNKVIFYDTAIEGAFFVGSLV